MQARLKRDIYFLRKTFTLAKKAEGFTSPNPLVGVLLVKGNKVVAVGYHRKAGLAHAEREAFKKVAPSVKGLTLYVNLEPCSHFGKTPPCVDEIIKRKVKRVVIANLDPNPRVKGKSIKKLKKAGIEVKVGLCRKEGERLNEVFFKNMRSGRPFVALKIAQSLDGKIATRDGFSKWITQEKTRLFAKGLRDKYDAVLVGINTAIKDNPQLNGLKKIPFKIVLDPHLRIRPDSLLLKKYPEKLILVTSLKEKKRLKRFPAHLKVLLIEEDKQGFLLDKLLRKLYCIGIKSILIEGGATTAAGFLEKKLIDKFYIFIAPKIIGGQKALSAIGGKGVALPSQALVLKEYYLERIGKDMLIWGYPDYARR